jgi:hypothetical protein
MKSLFLLLLSLFITNLSTSQIEISTEYNPDWSYMWYHDGIELGISKNKLYSIGRDVSGKYSVRISNECDTIHQDIVISKPKDKNKLRTVTLDECNTSLYTEEWYEKIDSKLEFIIFPNPTKEVINLRVYRGESENYQVIIYDQLGKVILKRKCKKEDQIDVSGLSTGIYIFEVTNDNIKKSELLFIF